MSGHSVDFEPVGRRGNFPGDRTFLEAARELGVGVVSVCGGRGTCGACRIQVVKGRTSPPSAAEQKLLSAEEMEKGWRLACQSRPRGNCRVLLPPESMTTTQRMQVEGVETPVAPEPTVMAYEVRLAPPTMENPLADASRILVALDTEYGTQCENVDLMVLRDVPSLLRQNKWRCQAVVRDHEVIRISRPGAPFLGLAIDMGTTKVAGYLVDLNSSKVLASRAIANPQLSYGEDIISRMVWAMGAPERGAKLRQIAVDAVNELSAGLCADAGAVPEDIVDLVAVGNTAIHHLLLGLPVGQLAAAPYVAAVRESVDLKARELGASLSKGAYVHLLPNIAGFVGADHTSALLSIDARRHKGRVMLVDIGTNTEISLINRGKISSVSCASGPAFEGGHIRYGMRASSGAIERMQVTESGVEYQTVDDAPPVGVCGSGILDAVSGMYSAGVLDEGGRMQPNHPNVRTEDGERQFVLVADELGRPKVAVTQKDVREVQLAKAAIRSGIQALLESQGLEEDSLAKVFIAGAFGSYIAIESATNIGMLPDLLADRYVQVGNAAGTGAKLALVSRSKREEAKTIAAAARYLELAKAPHFQQTFIEASYFGKYRLRQGRRERKGS